VLAKRSLWFGSSEIFLDLFLSVLFFLIYASPMTCFCFTLQTIDKLGKAGEVVKVAPGHFRNHLMPKMLAVPNLDKFAILIREQRKVSSVPSSFKTLPPQACLFGCLVAANHEVQCLAREKNVSLSEDVLHIGLMDYAQTVHATFPGTAVSYGNLISSLRIWCYLVQPAFKMLWCAGASTPFLVPSHVCCL
jgi:hypothetical protein